jgi:hypothetical protein
MSPSSSMTDGVEVACRVRCRTVIWRVCSLRPRVVLWLMMRSWLSSWAPGCGRKNMVFAPKIVAGCLKTVVPAIAVCYLLDGKVKKIQAVELPDRVSDD